MKNPTRPRTSYQWFYMSKYHDVALDNPKLKNKRIIKKVAKMWRELSNDEKLPYIEMYKQDIVRYEMETDFISNGGGINDLNEINDVKYKYIKEKNLKKYENKCRDIWIFISNILLVLIFVFFMRELFKYKTYAFKTPNVRIPIPFYNLNINKKVCSLYDYDYDYNYNNLNSFNKSILEDKYHNFRNIEFYTYDVPSYEFSIYIP